MKCKLVIHVFKTMCGSERFITSSLEPAASTCVFHHQPLWSLLPHHIDVSSYHIQIWFWWPSSHHIASIHKHHPAYKPSMLHHPHLHQKTVVLLRRHTIISVSLIHGFTGSEANRVDWIRKDLEIPWDDWFDGRIETKSKSLQKGN